MTEYDWLVERDPYFKLGWIVQENSKEGHEEFNYLI